MDMKRTVLITILTPILFCGSRQAEDHIIPGIGVPGVIELGWDKKALREHLGVGRARSIRNRSCVSYTRHFREYSALDIRAYFDRVEDSVLVNPEVIDCIWFGPRSGYGLGNGLRIGHATRADVYAMYGRVSDNPTADYDSLGLSFGFFHSKFRPYCETDTVDEISIFPLGAAW
jgi:hypothetical protein